MSAMGTDSHHRPNRIVKNADRSVKDTNRVFNRNAHSSQSIVTGPTVRVPTQFGPGLNANNRSIGITPVEQFHRYDPILLPVIPARLALFPNPGGPVALAG